jgi:hypothetical protein
VVTAFQGRPQEDFQRGTKEIVRVIGSHADMTDRYGRDLRTILRDGRSIADQLRDEGLVRRYLGYRMPWC